MAKKKEETQGPQLNPYQKFEVRNIHRGQLQNAPYNPRKIKDSNRAKLKANLKKNGLLDTLVWNEVTGNLVSGHQRLSILDELTGHDDYFLTVAVVQLTEKEEKEQNLFFNNKNAQGEFTFSGFEDAFKEIDFNVAGFEVTDLALFGFKTEKKEAPTKPEMTQVDMLNEIDKLADQKKGVQNLKKEIQDKIDQKFENLDAYVTLSFQTYDAKAAFMLRFGFPHDQKFINGEEFSEGIERI